MWQRVALLVSLSGCDLVVELSRPPSCPSTYVSIPGFDTDSRYRVETTERNFDAQQMTCRDEPGQAHLVVIETVEEALALRTLVAGRPVDTAYWIGLVQRDGEAEMYTGWEWITGEPLQVSPFWAQYQPNDSPDDGENNQQNRAAFFRDAVDGFVEDHSASFDAAGICECDGRDDRDDRDDR